MRMFATYFGGRLATCFDTREKADRYPGPRGVEGSPKIVCEMASAEWDDADAFQPDHSDPVLLYRRYKFQNEGQPEGFQSYGEWQNGLWYDLVFRCFVDDVMCWHELPALPLNGAAAKDLDGALRRHVRGESEPVAAAKPAPTLEAAAGQLHVVLNVLRNYIGIGIGTFLSKESADSMGRQAADACKAYELATKR